MNQGRFDWPLVDENDDGIRPAGKPDECFYCKRKVGERHKYTCVVVTKKVKIRAVVEYEIEVPWAWSGTRVEAHRNESSWCADNFLSELSKLKGESGCLCGVVDFQYIGTIDKTPRRGLKNDSAGE